ncbi:MAG: carboxypeptidase regulatory-like domain-containing protein [Treponema sp.]|nr:carboxypeptidase regulatory-like domain-containing protein [Treponema sp.]
MKKWIKFVLIIPFFISCASTQLSEKGNLVGLVVDENNKPVDEYVLHLETEKGKRFSAMTSVDGIFVIENLSRGNHRIEGNKDLYEKLNQELIFNDYSKVFCFEVLTADGIFNKANKKIKEGNISEADVLISKLQCNTSETVGEVLKFYKEKLNEMGELENE